MTPRTKDRIIGWAFIAPSLVLFGVFSYWPLYQLVMDSMRIRKIDGVTTKWVGPGQLGDALTSSEFFSGAKVSALFMVYTVPLGIVLGVLMAMSVHRRLRGVQVFQTIFSSTIASSAAVSSVIFLTLINPEVGYFKSVSFLSLSNPDTALFAVSLSSVWQNLGLTFVIVLAGLQAIPDELLEAALIDGYSPLRRFFRIVLPLLSPTLMFLAVVLVIHAFQAYAPMEVLTQGGPAGATESLVFKIRNLQAPQNRALGAGLSLGLFGLTVIVSSAQYRMLNRRVHYGR